MAVGAHSRSPGHMIGAQLPRQRGCVRLLSACLGLRVGEAGVVRGHQLPWPWNDVTQSVPGMVGISFCQSDAGQCGLIMQSASICALLCLFLAQLWGSDIYNPTTCPLSARSAELELLFRKKVCIEFESSGAAGQAWIPPGGRD